MKDQTHHKAISVFMIAVSLALAFSLAAGGSATAFPYFNPWGWTAPDKTLGVTLYVKPAASGTEDCSSWENACLLQAALTKAGSGDQIWVAAGVYTPGPSGNRLATFLLKNGVVLYGGFAGGESSLEERDWTQHFTILSGDIDGNDDALGGIVSDPDKILGENAYRVLSAVGISETATLDGLIITGGDNDQLTEPESYGGGLYSDHSNLAIYHVRFEGNSALEGGGMYNYYANPSLTNVTFSGNSADYGNGGGMYNEGGNPSLTNVIFSGNSALWGGGMYNWSASPTLTNVIFSGNSATESGGGMFNLWNSSPTLTNVTFSGNSATGNGGGMYNSDSSPSLANAIMWGNTPQQISGDAAIVNYSDIQLDEGVYEGTGNINADPQFVHASGGNLRLMPGSPAIDAGSNDALPDDINDLDGDLDKDEILPFDLDCSSRIVDFPAVHDPGEIVDMGAYEAQVGYPVIYVDQAAPGPLQDGSTWEQAFTDLQAALAAARVGDQVWVAGGVYTPGPSGNRLATFLLKNGVAVYGGFAGGESSLDDRDWTQHFTILSGDIDGNDVTQGGIVSDPDNIVGENAYRVVSAVNISETATLDGLIITGSDNEQAADPAQWGGGFYGENSALAIHNLRFQGNSAAAGSGMFLNGGEPIVLDGVEFINNTATINGGGLHTLNGSSPILTNVTFSGNSADNGSGGGMYNRDSSPTLINVTFSGNSANGGGGMHNYKSSSSLTNVTFYGNSATIYGGGMYNSWSSPSLSNVTFYGNSASTNGGGMFNYESYPTLTNVTFSGNNATGDGGGIYNIGSSPSLTNAIMWGNTPEQLVGETTVVTFSDIQLEEGEVYTGDGNINADPLLGPLADNGGFTLTFALGSGSPAIDAGHPTFCLPTDQRGWPRPVDGDLDGSAVCDMGAYEYSPYGFVYLPLVIK